VATKRAVDRRNCRRGRHTALSRRAGLVDSGSVLTGGVSLCIDIMRHLLRRLFGPETADENARMIEYDHARQANREKFPPFLGKAL
jgi:transcriptional regulator GlxA family with amidase domain